MSRTGKTTAAALVTKAGGPVYEWDDADKGTKKEVSSCLCCWLVEQMRPMCMAILACLQSTAAHSVQS